MFRRLCVPLLLIAFGVGGCGESSSSGSGSGSGSGGESDATKVGLALVTPQNDDSFGEENVKGIRRAAEKFEIDVSIVDGLEDPQAQNRALSNLARDNELVIAGGTELTAAVNTAAKTFPDTTFVLTDGFLEELPNTVSIVQDWTPLGYLAGELAADTTDSDVIGFVGGNDIPPTVQGLAGYKAAIKDADPSIRVLDTVVGSFSDPVRAKSAAAAQVSSGADVIYSFVDAGHQGVMQAIAESGKDVKVIGVIAQKCKISSGQDLGDTIHGIQGIIVNLVGDYIKDDLKSTVYSLEDPDVARLELCPQYASPERVSLIKRTTEAIRSDKVTLPDTSK